MGMDPQAAMRAAIAVPGVPRDADGPVFREPWEAQAFAMTLALHERGVFSWSEWAAALAAEIKRAQAAGDPDTGETYYLHWLNTLEKMVAEKGVTTQDTLHRYRDAWDRACDRTPHGEPIELTTRISDSVKTASRAYVPAISLRDTTILSGITGTSPVMTCNNHTPSAARSPCNR